MKQITLFFLLIGAILVSCNNDSDNSNGSSDKIIGTWGHYKDVYLPTNEVEIFNPYKSTDTFEIDGTVISESEYSKLEGTWKNLGGGVYKFTILSFTADNDVEFIGNNEMIIYGSNSNNEEASYYKRISN